jgi:hypothetical protein
MPMPILTLSNPIIVVNQSIPMGKPGDLFQTIKRAKVIHLRHQSESVISIDQLFAK